MEFTNSTTPNHSIYFIFELLRLEAQILTIVHFTITIANKAHFPHAQYICDMMENAAKNRGTGIAKRAPEYIRKKMDEGKAIIALNNEHPIGFCYIENWEGHKYVANSGLIVHPDYQKTGLARAIKQATFQLSKQLFPHAQLFGITTSMAVMKINSDLGYKPVTFSELTQDETFWKGCQSCVNYDILQRTNKSMCLCTGMVCDLSKIPSEPVKTAHEKSWDKFKAFLKERAERIKQKTKEIPAFKNVLENEK